MNTSPEQLTKKEHPHLSEDKSAPCVSKYRVPGCISHLFGNPAILLNQDPWLCVTRLLWFCPFGERFIAFYIQRPKEKQHLFLTEQNFLLYK